MVGFERDPHDDFATFLEKAAPQEARVGRSLRSQPVDVHLRAKHRLAGQFARFENHNPVYQMLVCRNLAWWRQEQRVWGKTKFADNGLTRGAGSLVWNVRMVARV